MKGNTTMEKELFECPCCRGSGYISWFDPRWGDCDEDCDLCGGTGKVDFDADALVKQAEAEQAEAEQADRDAACRRCGFEDCPTDCVGEIPEPILFASPF
jgi:RecJ-like exonuclease